MVIETERKLRVRTDLQSGAACYIVQPGDPLSGIAASYGTTVDAIYQSNRTSIGPDQNLIVPGQKLYIPD